MRPYAEDAYAQIKAEYTSPSTQNISPETASSEHARQPNGVVSPPGSQTPSPSHAPTTQVPIAPSPAPDVGQLSYFNQHVIQKGRIAEWDFPPASGTKTTPIWHAELKVDGKNIAVGIGITKKAAKNDAARKALEILGVDVTCKPRLSFPLEPQAKQRP